MIYKEFNKLKFKRTYIGGSKKIENKLLTDAQGILEDNSDCNWVEFEKLLIQYLDDILNIILSWKYIFNALRFFFIITVIPVSFINLYFSILVFLISIIFHLTFHYFKYVERKKLFEYNFIINFLSTERNK